MSKWDAAPVDLSGKTCFITGANGGIDPTTAKHFASLGATVLSTDIAKRRTLVCQTDNQ